MFIIYLFLLLSSATDSNGLAMAQKLEPIGGKGGKLWDDGPGHDYVTKVYVRGGHKGIHYIKFDYVKDGQSIDGSIHGISGDGFTQTLDIDQSNSEYMVSVDGYYDDKTGVMQALQFKSNLKTFELIGYPKGATKFSLGVTGKMIIGFHGFAGKYLNSLGAYLATAPPTKSELAGGLYGGDYWDDGPNYDGVRKVLVTYTDTFIRSISTDYDKDGQVVTSYHGNKDGETREISKLEPIGGKGGKLWDDGPGHDYVTKVYVRGGHKGIHYIKFDYVKDGQSIDGSIHGISGDGFTQTLDIDQSNSEYMVSVDGYYDDKTGVMQALQFKSNLKTFELIGYPKGATKFSLGVTGKMIIGFHGFAGKYLNSLGAYLATAPPTKSELAGGLYGGDYWDDGPNYDGVRKVLVTYTDTFIRSISTDYDKDGQVVTSYHGNKDGETREFVIDYPNEYLTSVEGTYNTLPDDPDLVVRSLVLKTSKGRISPTYGFVSGTKFVLERQGSVIVGFHGRDGWKLDAIGVYFSPVTTL